MITNIQVVTKKNIKKGEELLALYGRDYWIRKFNYEKLSKVLKKQAQKCYEFSDSSVQENF